MADSENNIADETMSPAISEEAQQKANDILTLLTPLLDEVQELIDKHERQAFPALLHTDRKRFFQVVEIFELHRFLKRHGLESLITRDVFDFEDLSSEEAAATSSLGPAHHAAAQAGIEVMQATDKLRTKDKDDISTEDRLAVWRPLSKIHRERCKECNHAPLDAAKMGGEEAEGATA